MKRPFPTFLLFSVLAFPVTAGVVINEVQSSNDATPVVDDRGEPMDWIELYNGGAEPVSLAGWGLSDKVAKDAFKFKFPVGASIAAHGHLVVICDKVAKSKDHYVTGFSLGANGETLTLTDADTNKVDEITFGMIPCDCSFGRVGGSDELKYFATPTPGTANNQTAYEAPLGKVAFSKERGVFTGSTSFEVALSYTNGEDNVDIYYTTDHSDPTASSTKYTEPISVSKTTIIRATAVKAGHLPYRNITTHSYLYLDQIVNQQKPSIAPTTWTDLSKDAEDEGTTKQGSCPASYTVSTKSVLTTPEAKEQFLKALGKAPVVSVTLSDADLFDPDNGIYCKPVSLDGKDEGKRAASVEWVTGKHVFCTDAGFCAHGDASRHFDYTPKKSFGLKFRGRYGANKLEEPVMDDIGYTCKEFKSLVLRGESNHSWPHTDKPTYGTSMHDQFLRDVSGAMTGFQSHGNQVHLFLNGLYWGLYNVSEAMDDHFAAAQWGGENEQYDVISGDRHEPTGIEVNDGKADDFNAVANGIRAMSAEVTASRVDEKTFYEKACAEIDLDRMIDYLILEWYVDNSDWPQKNWKATISKQLGVKLTYLAWDLDTTLIEGSKAITADPVKDKNYKSVTNCVQYIERALEVSAEYKLRFADRVHKHFFGDGALVAEKLVARYKTMAERVRPMVFAEVARWGAYRKDYYSGTLYNLTTWETEYNRLTSSSGFFMTRWSTYKTQLKNQGLYPSVEAAEFTVAADQKSATLKSVPSGTVYYTTDGSDPRVAYTGAVSAQAKTVAAGGAVEAAGLKPVKVRVLSDSTWSALTEIELMPPRNAYATGDNGEDWDNDANWTFGYFPNAPDAEASVGVPTELKKNATYRNIHIDSHDISVAVLSFTDGGKTNRIDTGKVGGDLNLYGTVEVKDTGAAMIDLDEPNVIRLCANVTADVAEGGELILKGALAGDGFNLLKNGPGTLTLACTNAAGTTFKLQCEEGAVAVTAPIAVSEVTKSGELWVKIGETTAETNALLTSAGKCNPNIRLFVPATEVGQVWVGGVFASSYKGAVQVFIPDANGLTGFGGQSWSPAADAPVKQVTVDGKLTFEVTVNSLEPVNNGKLRISEICPAPQVEVVLGYTPITPKTTDAKDPNGAVAGWIELVNEGTDPVNLAQYELQVVNRGKKASTGKFPNLPSRMLASGERVLVYTTKDYCEGGRFSSALMEEDSTRAFTAGEAPGIVADEIVLSAKVNPKKFPMVRLCRGDEVIQTVVVPCDLPDDAAVVAMESEEGGATLRYLTTHLTPGAANDLTGAVALGPNVGPLYGIKHSYSDLDPVPMATAGRNYPITLDVNPVDAENAADAIVSVTLVYRTDVNTTSEASFKTLTMEKGDVDAKGHGQRWTAAVPAANLPAEGMLLQWRAKITDVAGNTWTSPAFLDKDNGYGWYGTIVDPGVGDNDGQNSATLPTLHMFAETGANNKVSTKTYYLTDLPGKSQSRGDNCLMNLDYDETYEYPTSKDSTDKKNFRKFYPYGARVAIYDVQTSNYYDNVRIDCRGNSSDQYYKRSHGVRFPKVKPYKLAEPFTAAGGKEVDEVRKTSFHAEYNDPSYFRQRASFWFLNLAGSPAPYERPKRVNLNGQFYQFAYETPRFGDELLEDFYGFDPRGSGYKNIGAYHAWHTDAYGYKMGTSADAGTKKKLPDDGNEKDFSELTAFMDEISAAGNVTVNSTTRAVSGTDNASLTAKVVEKFDLPAWINYLAATRITQEGDDVWGNLGGYYESWTYPDGTKGGSGTWCPVAWDLNCAWGQFYQTHLSDSVTKTGGIVANQDWNKCHPFYGGRGVKCYGSPSYAKHYYGDNEQPNYAFESVYQSSKFRRLYLRRLRTLMDKYLKAPDTPAEDTPIAVEMMKYRDEILTECQKDRPFWGTLSSGDTRAGGYVCCWGTTMMSSSYQKKNQPDDPSYGYRDIWDNYIVPRRVHLFQTHAADNKSKTVGYGVDLNAGIPAAQSAFLALRDQITIRYDAEKGAAIIENANAEAVDISGWKVSGPVEMTLPPGTVVDQKNGSTPGQVFVTADRRATIAAMTLTDQVVVGNGAAGEASAKPRLITDTDERVYPLTVHYTISYDANGGEGEIESGTAESENDFETAPCTFTKAGKVCTGWGTNGVDGLVFVCEPGEKVTNLAIEDGAEVTLSAMWEPKMPSPDDLPEAMTNLTLSVGETMVFTNRYRKNLRFWLLGSDGAGECVEASINLPTNACEQYRGYVARSVFKTNEVIVTITGKVKGEETVSLGRQYKFKEPRCAVRYTVIVE